MTTLGLEELLAASATAAAALRATSAEQRADWLQVMAERLDRNAFSLVSVADAETRLGKTRLLAEVARTSFQLRFFSDVLADGHWMRVTIDRADQNWPIGARPDLRSMLVPIGPVLVFAAGNFPFAFSVAGGDTASAIAAGCPVLLKAHPGHPSTSALTSELIRDALTHAGAPVGSFALIESEAAARGALVDPRVSACAFTGSVNGGRALFNLACSRPTPIPFYAEMGSLNPVFLTNTALADRREEIIEGLVGSFTLGRGQFCTKPGLVVAPSDGAVAPDLAARVADLSPQRLLNEHVTRRYFQQLRRMSSVSGVRTLAGGPTAEDVFPTVLEISVRELLAHRRELLAECFGPMTLVANYSDNTEMLVAAKALDGQLTATIHGRDTDPMLRQLIELLSERVGRVIWNGWPTGVAVTWGMQHGGPYPATTSPLHTSVGANAIQRFLRPVTYQSFPDQLLPRALRADNPMDLPRRVDGNLSQ